MATPMGGNFFNLDYLLGEGLHTALNHPWAPWAGITGLALSDLVPAVYKKLKQGLTKTKYGITNETKLGKRGKTYKTKYRMYKWVNNRYNYKLDFVVQMYIAANTNVIAFQILGDTVVSNTDFNVLTYAPDQERFVNLKNIFNEYKLSGIAATYKPYQVVKTDPNDGTNGVPNMLFQILTGIEAKQNAVTTGDPTDGHKQLMTDYPYSRLISADDDFRMYRPFKFKKIYSGYNEAITDDLLHRYVPTSTPANETRLSIRSMLVPGYGTVRTSRWNLGTLTVSLYYRFRNSKI